MKKIIILLTLSFLAISFFSFKVNSAYAKTCWSDTDCASGQTCGNYYDTGAETPPIGECLGTNAGAGTGGGGGGGGGGGIGDWGAPGSGPSLGDVSKLLGSGAPNNASKAGFNAIISLFLGLLILAAIILSLLYLIWGGFDWITSEGNKQKLDQARQKIVFAIIGLIVVFLAFFVVNVISSFFGVK